MSILLETALAHLTHNGIEDSFNVKKQSTFKIDLLERIQKAYLNFKIIRCITLDYIYSISRHFSIVLLLKIILDTANYVL